MKRFILVCLAMGGLSLASLALASAFSSKGNGATERWSWDTSLPGEPTPPTDLTIRAARFSDVIPSTLRTVISVQNSDGARLTISAGSDVSGQTCFGLTALGIGRDFDCLDARTKDFAIIPYVSMGGSRLQTVDRAAVMGIARSDVSRIELRLTDGSRRDISLNRWRAFAFLADEASPMPETLTAYGAGGSILQQVNVSVGPV